MIPTLNLASRSYLNKRGLYACYALLGAGLILLLAWNLNSYYADQAQSRLLKAHLAEANRKITLMTREDQDTFSEAGYRQLMQQIAFANAILKQDSFHWTELLNRLEDVVPNAVRIQGIQPDYQKGKLNLTGVARTVADLRRFLDNLIRSPHFEEVYLLQQSRVPVKENGREHQAVDFTIVVKGAF